MSEDLFIISARSAEVDLVVNDFEYYITTNELFNKFFKENTVLSSDFRDSHPHLATYVKEIRKAEKVGENYTENRDIQGIREEIGSAVVGFSRVREEFVYVKCQGVYFRGLRVFFGDLGKIIAEGHIEPLDKDVGNGNIEIIVWNKRKSVSEVKFIHNKLQSIMYVIDLSFDSYEEVIEDMKNPQYINLSRIIEPLLM